MMVRSLRLLRCLALWSRTALGVRCRMGLVVLATMGLLACRSDTPEPLPTRADSQQEAHYRLANAKREFPFVWDVEEWEALSPHLTRFGIAQVDPACSLPLGRLGVRKWGRDVSAFRSFVRRKLAGGKSTTSLRLIALDFSSHGIRLAYLHAPRDRLPALLFAVEGLWVSRNFPALVYGASPHDRMETDSPWFPGEFGHESEPEASSAAAAGPMGAGKSAQVSEAQDLAPDGAEQDPKFPR